MEWERSDDMLIKDKEALHKRLTDLKFRPVCSEDTGKLVSYAYSGFISIGHDSHALLKIDVHHGCFFLNVKELRFGGFFNRNRAVWLLCILIKEGVIEPRRINI